MKIIYVTRTVNVATLILAGAFLISGHFIALFITVAAWLFARQLFKGIFF